MPPKLALFLCILFEIWLFRRWRKCGNKLSVGLWIPLLWLLILGSRPVSLWLNPGAEEQSTDNYLEGSPFDRFIFVLLIAAGLCVLTKRRMSWRRFAQD